MTEQEIKNFIRDNVVMTLEEKYGSFVLELRIKGDTYPFTSVTLPKNA